MNKPSDEVTAALRTVPARNTDKVIAAAQAMYQLQLEIAALEERLSAAKQQLNTFQHETLPDLMDQAGVDRFGFPAQGNLPPCDVMLTPYYHANIAASWPVERRNAALDMLSSLGHEDLIKTEITVALPRQQRALAMRIINALQDSFQITPALRESVHSATLTAWLKEQFERHNPLPPLDVIGATVGRIVKIKERKNG